MSQNVPKMSHENGTFVGLLRESSDFSIQPPRRSRRASRTCHSAHGRTAWIIFQISYAAEIGIASARHALLLTASFTDPGGEEPTTYAIVWGDGSDADTYGLSPDYHGRFPHQYTEASE